MQNNTFDLLSATIFFYNKSFVLSIFEWSLKTGFTVLNSSNNWIYKITYFDHEHPSIKG